MKKVIALALVLTMIALVVCGCGVATSDKIEDGTCVLDKID